jgi:mono/diheme cytochrome c family protein
MPALQEATMLWIGQESCMTMNSRRSPGWLWTRCGALALGLIACLAAAREAAPDPMIAKGEQLAQLICSACHVVAHNQQFSPILREPAPSFEQIANRPDTTEKSLREFLKTTHWDNKTLPMTMPDPMLVAEQRQAVARYILSLRSKQ